MPVNVDRIIRSKRKTLALIVRPDGSLIVRAPLRTPENSIREFIEQHAEWAEKKQAEMLTTQRPAPRHYLEGEMFLYLGNRYPLVIVKDQKEPLRFDGSFKLAHSARGRAAQVFEAWYRRQATEILMKRVNYYARQHNFQYKGIRITAARTRWGSCSANGSLSFSWHLIQAPLEAIDYVVVHELAHTALHNHSEAFWRLVGTIIPDYAERREWFRKNGRELMC